MDQTSPERKYITADVLMIRPLEYGHRIFTEVITVQEVYVMPFKPIDVIKFSCSYYGSSLDGRLHGTKSLIQVTKKCPIMVEPESKIFMFPSKSPFHPECCWIAQSNVLDIEPTNEGETLVYFEGNRSEIVPMSHTSFLQQMRKTAMLQVSYLRRRERSNTHASLLLHEKSSTPFRP